MWFVLFLVASSIAINNFTAWTATGDILSLFVFMISAFVLITYIYVGLAVEDYEYARKKVSKFCKKK